MEQTSFEALDLLIVCLTILTLLAPADCSDKDLTSIRHTEASEYRCREQHTVHVRTYTMIHQSQELVNQLLQTKTNNYGVLLSECGD